MISNLFFLHSAASENLSSRGRKLSAHRPLIMGRDAYVCSHVMRHVVGMTAVFPQLRTFFPPGKIFLPQRTECAGYRAVARRVFRHDACIIQKKTKFYDAKLFCIRCFFQGKTDAPVRKGKIFSFVLTKGAPLHTPKESSSVIVRSISCPQPSLPSPLPVSGGGVSFLQGEDAVLTRS